jgi:hypothetical protein
MAMTTGLRSTIDGITKLHKSGESTTLTGILAFFANSDTLAISSAGKAPVLARLIRAKLESTIPNAYGKLATLAGNFRNQVKARPHNTQVTHR